MLAFATLGVVLAMTFLVRGAIQQPMTLLYSGLEPASTGEIIDELEPHRRGIYAGAVGYFGAGGGMDTCIALRTAVIKDGVMHVQAGAGIVLDSDPEAEHMETVNKAKALFRAAAEAWRFA